MIENGYQHIYDLTANVKTFFVIPKDLEYGDVKIPSIGAKSFNFSSNGKWISFIVSPTASLSMDSNMLCIISTDGKEFTVIDEVALNFNPKWAINKELLGYIAGEGRIVFGFKNKEMKVTELPAYHTLNLTPKNYAELGFAWVNGTSLIVSRVKETDWSNEPANRPKPALFHLTLVSQKQKQITTPPKGMGDYHPEYLASIQKVAWVRKSDIAKGQGDLWIADEEGDNAELWIKDIEGFSFFPSN